MIIEFELRDFDKTSLSDQAKVRRERGRYFISFHPRDPGDCRQFLRCLERNEIVLDAHSAKDLARFHPAFGEPECKKIIADLASMRKSLPALVEESDTGAAEAAVMKAALDENTDVSRTDALFAEMRKKQDGAELAKVKVSTARRRVAELESNLREALSAYRKREAEKLRSQLAPKIELFNSRIEAAYAEFVPIAREILPQIAESEPGFSRDIYFTNPTVPVEAGKALKTLQSMPRVNLGKSALMFVLKEVK
jgi:hypothetical protein